MNDKQINRYLRRRFSQVAWTLIVYYLMMTLLAAMSMELDIACQMLWGFLSGEPAGTVDMEAISGNAWSYVVTIVAGGMILYGWQGLDFWKREVMVKDKPMRPGVLLCLVVLCMGAQMANSLWISLLETLLYPFGMSVMPVLETVSGQSDTFSMFLYASLLAPVSEELLFRGFVLGKLRPFGKRFAVLGSAILFGLFHGNLLQTPYAFVMGLLFGYVTVEYSIGWAVALHMFNNLVLAELLSRVTALWSDMAYGVLNMVLFGGAFVASLGILAAKRRKVREYRRSEWIDRRCVKWFFLNSGMVVFTGMMLWSMISLLFV